MKPSELLFDDWHPVAALAELPAGLVTQTRLLGRDVHLPLAQDGAACASWCDAGVQRPMSTQARYGALWVSFADAPPALFDVPEFAEGDRRVVSAGSTRVNVSGLRAIENFLDMAHFPFVHTDILGAEPLTEVEAYHVRLDEASNEIFATECRFAQPRASATAVEPIETQ